MDTARILGRGAAGRNAVRVCKDGAVAKGVLRLHELLGRQTVLLHVGRAQVVPHAALLSSGDLVQAVVGEFVGVVGEFVLLTLLAAAVQPVEDAEDDEEAYDSAGRLLVLVA